MRFKATLVELDSISTLSKIVATVSKVSKYCVIRLTTDKICLIVTENQLHGGTNLWCEIPQVNFCAGYEFVGHTETNEAYLEISLDLFSHALKSAQNAKALRLKLTQKVTGCLTLEVVMPSISSKNRMVVHDIPIRIIPSRLWSEYREPDIHEFDVSLYLPPLRTFKSILDKLKNISNALSMSMNSNGDMLLKVKSEMASINVSFKDLMPANWKDTTANTSQLSSARTSQVRKEDFHEAIIDNKRLYTFLTGVQLHTDKIVCNIIAGEAVQLFLIYDHLSIQYTIPAQNVV